MAILDEIVTNTAEETIAFGRKLASKITPPKLLLLRGELGAGKTTLVKGVIERLLVSVSCEVTSPTFTLIHEYHSPRVKVYHIDLYRVDTQRELETLGLDDLFDERSVVIIEWGEKFERFRRERDLEIAFEHRGENQRKIVVTA